MGQHQSLIPPLPLSSSPQGIGVHLKVELRAGAAVHDNQGIKLQEKQQLLREGVGGGNEWGVQTTTHIYMFAPKECGGMQGI